MQWRGLFLVFQIYLLNDFFNYVFESKCVSVFLQLLLADTKTMVIVTFGTLEELLLMQVRTVLATIGSEIE